MSESDARQRIGAQTVSGSLWRSAATRILCTDGEQLSVQGLVTAAFDELLGGR